MPLELFERGPSLALLHHALDRTRAGEGQTVLVAGEAGIGKSSLINHFARQAAGTGTLRVLWGGCDALATPRPLGPLYDMAAQCAGGLLQTLEQRPQMAAVFAVLHAELLAHAARAASPSLLIFEDLHWADHATLDLVQLLGRRVMRLPAMLVLSYRDGPGHGGSPLQKTLAGLPAAVTTHLRLAPLSPQAVATLAAHDARSPEHLVRLTQGNPFFLSEVLACPDTLVPATVREAVLARVHALPPDARRICEVVSVEPGHAPLTVIDPLFVHGGAARRGEALDRCIEAGVLLQDDAGLRFRHELARLAVADHLPPQRRRSLHAMVWRRLRALPDVPRARLVHHAAGAGLVDAVLELAPLAAQDATRHGAHREALAHLAAARQHLEKAPPMQQAQILEGWAHARAVTHWTDAEVVAAMEQAVALWQRLGQPYRAGAALQHLALMLQGLWDIDGAERCLEQATTLLESGAPPEQRAQLYNQRAYFSMRSSQTAQALEWGRRALQVTSDAGLESPAITLDALAATGSALTRAGSAEGERRLRDCLDRARGSGHYLPMIAAFMYLAESTLRQCRFAEAEDWSRQALVALQDAEYIQHYFLGLQAQLLVARGDHAQAMARAAEVLDALTGPPTVMQWPLLHADGLARCRSGTPGGVERLRQCYTMSHGRIPYYVLPAAAALVEGLLLQGEADAARVLLQDSWALRGGEVSPWLIGPLQVWARRLGVALDPAVPAGAPAPDAHGQTGAAPFTRELGGDPAGAAAFWADVGVHYAQAQCLMQCGAQGVQEAIAIWGRLGAAPAERLARAEARRMGLRGLRRGPYGSARIHPLGLSAREQQVLQLLAEGHSNAAIAQRLTRSERTVEHHVSRMLAKTGASHRTALVAQAREFGLLDAPETA